MHRWHPCPACEWRTKNGNTTHRSTQYTKRHSDTNHKDFGSASDNANEGPNSQAKLDQNQMPTWTFDTQQHSWCYLNINQTTTTTMIPIDKLMPRATRRSKQVITPHTSPMTTFTPLPGGVQTSTRLVSQQACVCVSGLRFRSGVL